MDKRDIDMIKAMAFIRQYCRDMRGCNECPMFDNCKGSNVNEVSFPYYWYIPEV